MERFLKDTILNKLDIIYAYPLSEILTARIKLTCHSEYKSSDELEAAPDDVYELVT